MRGFENLKMGESIPIDTISNEFLEAHNIQMDILRLDLIHPLISGNKWFKLKYNLQQASEGNYKTLLSFGGAYSNHLHALAYAGKLFNVKTIGIIRGEEVMNQTLQDCIDWGMQLHFISRSDYRNKSDEDFLSNIQGKFPEAYIIPEGGNNELGFKGTKEILANINLQSYQLLCCAVGTGATLSGLIESALPTNKVIGFVVMKNGLYLAEEIKMNTSKTNWQLNHDYHFGGFGKTNEALKEFMFDFEEKNNIELDRVYTVKMMAGIYTLIENKEILETTKILFVHTGGLQGNRSEY